MQHVSHASTLSPLIVSLFIKLSFASDKRQLRTVSD